MEKLPRLLVVSINAWRDNTGINTLIELLRCWDRDSLGQIYTRSALPKAKICSRFFRISENAVMKSCMKRNIKTGSDIRNESDMSGEDEQGIEKEKQLYQLASKKHSILLSWMRELVWFFGKWKTKELDQFIDDFHADVLFLPIYPTIYMGRIQEYVIKKTKKPAVCYLADDNYTYKPCGKNILAHLHRFFLRKKIRRIVNYCDQMFVIAPKQKEEYDHIFGVDSIVLTKGIDFSEITYTEQAIHHPIKMVYTGKLIIGRWKSLAAIADALEQINHETVKMQLDIYTTDALTEEQDRQLNKGACCVKGSVPLDQVEQIQREADIVIFVESLDKKYRNAARLSFSTKLTDYLKSGKCIFAIGDREIAPIDYMIQNNSAVTATSYQEILTKLNYLCEHPEMILQYGRAAFNCAKRNHDRVDINQKLIHTIRRACNATVDS